MTPNDRRKFVVAIVAAGRGERAGQSVDGPKQYRKIGGQAVLAHTIRAFSEHPDVGQITIAIHPDDTDLFNEAVGELPEHVSVVEGGPSRQASVRHALRALVGSGPQFVLIHDGVRPFVDIEMIDRLSASMDGETGALPALPVSDTLKKTGKNSIIEETQPREGLYSAQTPQAFPFRAILDAHERARESDPNGFTDDAALAEWAGIQVKIVEGSPKNIKLTWAQDIASADRTLSDTVTAFPDIRTGSGFDVHKFEPGDHVLLCGVEIQHEFALSGHSDADVGLHALTDALLATCGEGDIGTHFPPSDKRWKDAASHIFLEHAAKLVRDRGGRIANVDVTIIAEAPKIGPHRQAMTERLAAILEIANDRISVKATTSEGLGFTGRREGIAAMAGASVIYPGEVPE